MSENYRSGTPRLGGIATFIAAAAIVCLLGLSASRYSHNNERKEAARVDSELAVSACRRSAESEPDMACVIESLDAQHEQQHAAADLRAQQEMAEYALLMLIITAMGVIYVALTLEATRDAVREAERASAATEKMFTHAVKTSMSELRARISVEPRGINRLIGGDNVIGLVALRNIGKLPARNVSVVVYMDTFNTRYVDQFRLPDELKTDPRVVQPGTEMLQGSGHQPPASNLFDSGSHVFVWGIATYDDGYESQRYTKFCHRYATASRNRSADKIESPRETVVVIGADKARYHTHGNDAN